MHVKSWSTGSNNFFECSLEQVSPHTYSFTTTLKESDIDHNKTIDDIFYDHLNGRHTTGIELLFSGGMDSEMVLRSCVRNKIPVEAVTMAMTTRGALINVYDMYYAERMCRELGIKQRIVTLDVDEFYEGGMYLDYSVPFFLTEPHVPSHNWLLEQCDSFPVIAGDWPWVQAHREEKILSPYKIDFCSYEEFLKSKGMIGIGNMIGHSFESCYRFAKLQIQNYVKDEDKFETVPFLKLRMYPDATPRLKSYGWEHVPFDVFNIRKYQLELVRRIGKVAYTIKWGDKLSELLGTTANESKTFR